MLVFRKCIYTSCPCYLPVAQPPEESLKKEPSINKVLREEKEDIEAQKYDASMILWYSKICMKKKKRGQTDVTEKP